MKKCPYCGENIQNTAKKCKHCGEWLKEEKNTENEEENIGTDQSFKVKRGYLRALFFVALFVVAGNYHIVVNAPSFFVARPYFGFSDMIGDVNACTSTPWLVAINNHPSLCRALQNAGYLESDEDMQTRTQENIKNNLQKSQDCMAKCNVYDSNYSKCVSNCY